MSDIKVNNIQGLEGTHGPVVSGITTMASSGAMLLPRGDTAFVVVEVVVYLVEDMELLLHGLILIR